jgi:hypothetical protein
MTWLISEIIVWLSVAGALGALVGWFLRGTIPATPAPQLPAELADPEPARRADGTTADVNVEIARKEMELQRLMRQRDREEQSSGGPMGTG